jgi:hypothetical protein
MSNTSYILNQKINNIRSFIDNNSDIEEQVSLRSDLQANDFNIEGVTVIQSQFVETNSINSTENNQSLAVLADCDFQSTSKIDNTASVSSNGYTGKSSELVNIFVNSGISDLEGATYQWGQRYTPFKPTFPHSWGISLNNICLNCKVNSYIALRVIPTSNASTSSYLRRELNTVNTPIKIENSDLIRLNFIKFKANSSISVKIEGVRLLNDTINTTYGKTKLNIRVWGTDMENTEVCNEIFAYLDDEIDAVNTDYSVEIYGMAQFSCTANAWLYENGFF